MIIIVVIVIIFGVKWLKLWVYFRLMVYIIFSRLVIIKIIQDILGFGELGLFLVKRGVCRLFCKVDGWMDILSGGRGILIIIFVIIVEKINGMI